MTPSPSGNLPPNPDDSEHPLEQMMRELAKEWSDSGIPVQEVPYHADPSEVSVRLHPTGVRPPPPGDSRPATSDVPSSPSDLPGGIRELLKRDHGIDVRISGGIGRRDDPYVVEKCAAGEAALTQLQLLRGLGRGLGELWRIIDWTPCSVGTATDVIRIEAVRFTETQIESVTRGVYFDTRAVTGVPHALHPLIAWRGPSGAPLLPFELGWLHFDQVFNNAACGSAFDQTILFSGAGAKASVYVYARSIRGGGATRDAELQRAAGLVRNSIAGLEEPWPVFEVGALAVKYFLSGADLTLVGVAVSGPYFVKVRLTFFDDLKMRDMMRATLTALGARIV